MTITRSLREWWLDLLVNGIGGSLLIPKPFRWRYLRPMGYRIDRCHIASGGYIGGRRLAIHSGVFLNRGVFLDTSADITIGANSALGMGVMLVTSSHEMGDPRRRAGAGYARPITVGRGVWIGARATVMPGVAIGDGAVIAAGALVTKDCDNDTLYVGVPARAVRHLA